MTYLLLQTFLLLISAFFFGALTGCIAKRAINGTADRDETVAVPAQAGLVTPAAGPLPRVVDPIQPKIETVPRPIPVSQPPVKPAVQPAMDGPANRFDRALGVSDGSVSEQPAPSTNTTSPSVPASSPAAAARASLSPLGAAAAAAAAVAAAQAAADANTPKAPVKAAPPSAAPTPPADPGDDMTRIRSIDNLLWNSLYAMGLRRYDQIARLPATDIEALDKSLGLKGRIDSEGWVEQARVLAGLPALAPQGAAGTEPAPVPDTAPAPVSAPVEAPLVIAEGSDDLTRIRAIDNAQWNSLYAYGIRRFEQIALWTPDDIEKLDKTLGLDGRIDREQWVEQAQILAKGGETYYSRTRAASASDAMAAKRSPSDMAAAGAAAMAAASATVTRGMRPLEPGSPLEGVDPNISRPARLADAIKENEAKVSGAPQSASQSMADADTDTGKVAARTDLGHLRSVRSEALRAGESAETIDDLKRVRGIGVLIERKLNALGITSYQQIADWTSEDIDRVSQSLDFKGRIERENWIDQARILTSGGQTEFPGASIKAIPIQRAHRADKPAYPFVHAIKM